MWIVKLTANPNGSHNNQKADHISEVPDGWAMIPDDFSVPSSFPFVDMEAEEWDGVLTVTNMVGVEVPDAPEPAPTWNEQMEAQITYTAMMTDTLLEV